MKSIFLFALAILLHLFSNAQPLPLWSSSINGHFPFFPEDPPSKIKMDYDGNLVVLSSMDSSSNLYFLQQNMTRTAILFGNNNLKVQILLVPILMIISLINQITFTLQVLVL